MSKFRFGLALTASAMALTCGAAGTQQAPATDILEEIVVTAQKRTENLQDVPLAVTAISGDALARAGVDSFSDLTKVVPSLTFTPGDQPANSSIILRGIGTFAFSIGVEPSVAVVIDDVPLAFQAQAFTDLIDLDRVEVLRGPQSTLFGKAASAGLVNVTTSAPTDTFTAKADLRIATKDEQRAAFSVSGPISETLGFRLSADASHFGGLVTNLETGEKINGRKEKGVRGKLQWTPSEALNVTFNARYRKTDADCCVGVLQKLDPTANFYNLPGFPQSTVLAGITPGKDNLNIRLDEEVKSNTKDRGGSVRVAYDFEDVTLMSISSFTKFDLSDAQDLDGTAANFNPVVNPGAPAGGRVNYGQFKAESVTQELRLVSTGDGPFSYVGGLFFADTDLSRWYYRGPTIGRSNWDATAGNTNYAAFAQGNWEFVEGTSLITGLRLVHEIVDYKYANLLTGARFAGDADDDAVTGKIGLEHHINDDVMLFGFYARGYKGQTFDLTSSFNAAIAARGAIKPETSDDFEAGVRSTLLDRRLILNATLFHTDYNNFQAQESEPTLAGAFILSNVGSVRTRGVELETTARIGSDLDLTGGVSYIEAEVKDYARAQCYPGQNAAQGCVGGVQNLAGEQLNNAPRWRFNLRGDYNIDLPDNLPVDAIISASYNWQSKVNFSLSQDPLTQQGAYGIANLQVGLRETEDDLYRVTFFANNLFDRQYAAGLANSQNYYGGRLAVNRQTPRDYERYYGVRLQLNY
ncbi:TonB-dependent receptor [Niveispirillum sp. KHB5.9]|uniref:TonB-dependent receptor n=1 Tax=Niveispirillum sp. KHB5.9 TaxID=3400269 RepID=UPI003A83CF9C